MSQCNVASVYFVLRVISPTTIFFNQLQALFHSPSNGHPIVKSLLPAYMKQKLRKDLAGEYDYR